MRRVAGAGRLFFVRLRLERFHGLIDLEADGLADVHAHDQVRAALEIESAPDRLGVALRRDDRDREHHQHRDDQHDFPDARFYSRISSRDALCRVLVDLRSIVSDSPVTMPETAERATLTFTFSAIFR